jgi:iron complex transport system substrate-binding protein
MPLAAPVLVWVSLCTPSCALADAPARRIVSLAPNLTELVFTAGAGDRLAGVDSVSDYPVAVRGLPRIGDAFQIDYERVLALQPDLVLAWVSGTPEPAITRLQRLGLRVERVEVSSLTDIADAIRRIGALAGTGATAGRAADEYLRRIAQLRARRSRVEPVSVFYQISANPLYTVSDRHLISEVIALCGGRNIFAGIGQLAPPVSPEAVLERDPQVILAGDGAEDDPLAMWRRWPRLQAVRGGHLYTVRADHLARATTRVVLGAQQVCALLDQVRAQQIAAKEDSAT